MKKQIQERQNERGNVLFLILIAVALFAALSYAVTKSTRSGSGSTDREQAILGSASMTQHPTALRTAIIRMILSGTAVGDIKFNSPANLGAVSNDVAVFASDGGGAVFQEADADVMNGSTPGTWFFNLDFEIPDIGASGGGGADLIAFLPNVTRAVCVQVNNEFNIDMTDCAQSTASSVIPVSDATRNVAAVSVQQDNTYTFTDATDAVDLLMTDSGGTCGAFDGQPSGCYEDNNGAYIFFSVLLER